MPSEYPLVSCIMPTKARPQFAQEALACFRAQTWPNKELVIVDEAFDPSFAEPPTGPGIVYDALRQNLTIGAKRNVACSMANGDIICHFDSDDWSAPERVEDQVRRMAETDKPMTGYSSMRFTDGSKWWLYTGSNGYILGTSFMYQRAVWRTRTFKECNTGEDLLFQAGRSIASAPAGNLMWARIHRGNTSPRRLQKPEWEELAA